MAVLGANYNPQLGTNDYNYAYQVWKNVNFENNSIKISQEELDAFNERWEKEFKSWETKYQEEDSVEYDVEDIDDFDISSLENTLSNSNTKSKSVKGASIATTSMGFVSVAGNIGATVGAVNLSAQAAALGSGVFVNATTGAVITSQSLTAASTSLSTIAKAFCFVGCTLTLATGVLYQATKPNKDAHQALMELQKLMLAGNADIEVQQLLMEQTQEQITNTANTTELDFEEAEAKQETEKSELEQKQEELAVKTELLLMATIIQESIRTRLESGETLSDSDKAQFKAASASIQSLTGEVTALQNEIATLQGNINSEQEAFEQTKEEASNEMNSLQSTYSERVDRFNELKQITDLAGSFDEITHKLCKSQIAMQALNVASGALNMLSAMKYGFIGLPFAAMAATGVGLSAAGIAEQKSFKKDIEGEMATRARVQENLASSFNFFTSAVNQYATDNNLVKNLNLETVETGDIPQAEAGVADNTLPTETAPTQEQNDKGAENNPFVTSSAESGETTEEVKKNPFAV